MTTSNRVSDRSGPENRRPTVNARHRLKEFLLKAVFQNEGAAPHGAYIDDVIDSTTGRANSMLTPGGQIHLIGDKIKVAGEEDAVGLWFVSQAAGNPRTKGEMNFRMNKTNEVLATIPPLPAGIYHVEIVTRYSGGFLPLKEPRVITARPLLSVGEAQG